MLAEAESGSGIYISGTILSMVFTFVGVMFQKYRAGANTQPTATPQKQRDYDPSECHDKHDKNEREHNDFYSRLGRLEMSSAVTGEAMATIKIQLSQISESISDLRDEVMRKNR
jgi:predicted nuclease with TOPRIM domain